MAASDAETRRLTSLLAVALLADDIDPLGVVENLAPLLAPQALAALCAAMELCPVHLCDAAICADDDIEECRQARA